MSWYTALLCALIAFAVTAAIGPKYIRYLQKMKFGQKILEIGPRWHMNKQYTPTMGGFMFIFGITVAMLVMYVIHWIWTGGTSSTLGVIGGADGPTAIFVSGGASSALGVIGSADTQTEIVTAPTGLLRVLSDFSVWLLALAYGLVGFVDDHAKIKKKQNAGLTALQKLLLQIVVAAVFLSLLRLAGLLSSAIRIPGTEISIALPWVIYLIFAIFVVVGCDNAVNLTDGIDGLAASVTLPVALFFLAVGFRQNNLGVILFSSALAGALIAFLIFNWNPARVFMGDTGSLFLGGAVAGLAFACDMPLILIPVGLIYIVETMSDIIQVTYFKLSHGKRIFKMAPIHHHFEMCGWGEKKIVLVFTSITAVMCVLAWMLVA